jgi:cation diffusion facilitator family transporter
MYLQKVRKLFFISTAITFLLLAVKILFGYIFKSQALIYDGFESLSDIILFGIMYGAAILAEKPPDREHLYGHSKLESLASLYVGIGILSLGGYLLYRSISSIVRGVFPKPYPPAFIVAVAVVAVKEFLYFYTLKAARDTKSPVLHALALDHHKDALSSLITVAGTAGSLTRLHVLDPAAASITSAVIIYMGVKTLISSSSDLLDRSPEREVNEKIREIILGTEGVRSIRKLRARKSGRAIYIDADIAVDGNLKITTAHDIATVVKNRIKDKIENVKDVVVHIEPED